MTETLKLFNETEAADTLRLSKRTLQKWRVKGGGPLYRQIGSRIVYMFEDLKSFLDKRKRSNTSEKIGEDL
jgi:hypothetical protein|tara:strand:- start:6 stop:218 length:213 start_codon:yes stop_codon:yes gene_type:complete